VESEGNLTDEQEEEVNEEDDEVSVDSADKKIMLGM